MKGMVQLCIRIMNVHFQSCLGGSLEEPGRDSDLEQLRAPPTVRARRLLRLLGVGVEWGLQQLRVDVEAFRAVPNVQARTHLQQLGLGVEENLHQLRVAVGMKVHQVLPTIQERASNQHQEQLRVGVEENLPQLGAAVVLPVILTFARSQKPLTRMNLLTRRTPRRHPVKARQNQVTMR